MLCASAAGSIDGPQSRPKSRIQSYPLLRLGVVDGDDRRHVQKGGDDGHQAWRDGWRACDRGHVRIVQRISGRQIRWRRARPSIFKRV